MGPEWLAEQSQDINSLMIYLWTIRLETSPSFSPACRSSRLAASEACVFGSPMPARDGLLSCRAQPRVDGSFTITQVSLTVGDVSLGPQLSVTGDRAIVSWIDTGGRTAALKFAERTGSGWSVPRMVASGDDWFINWADVPSVVRLADGTLAAHWLKEVDPKIEAYDLNVAFSKDDGRTWSAPVTPHHDGTKSQHGFATLFQAPGAGLGLIWLDGRSIDEASGRDDMSVRSATFDRDGKEIAETWIVDERLRLLSTAVATTWTVRIAAFATAAQTHSRCVGVAPRQRPLDDACVGARRPLADHRVAGERSGHQRPWPGRRRRLDDREGGRRQSVRRVLERRRRLVRRADPPGRCGIAWTRWSRPARGWFSCGVVD
jgi:hypothetical protein